LFVVDQSWRRLTEEQEREIEWIRDNISLVLRRSTVLLNRYSLHFSGLASIPKPCKLICYHYFSYMYTGGYLIGLVLAVLHQYRRYRRLSDSESMGRERRDFYQVTKAAGGTPATEEQMKAADGTAKRKKKKAERVRVASEPEAELDEASKIPVDEVVPVEAAAASKKRAAREEVNLLTLVALNVVLSWQY
jgi:hypothetical protein